ncbi:hypothetical protein PBR20603_04504 [Pandoraea bronchicola]|uniref:Uncharacterized protein n=1 Tax=Pandoraea bronchicola TaxID=2508287 RepID=A0A5E5BXJ8_9BURK|nr:hypothetical protein PBR20603_04504 [Pandoraea bronchicola]
MVRVCVHRVVASGLVANVLDQPSSEFPDGWPFRDVRVNHVAKLLVDTTWKLRPDILGGAYEARPHRTVAAAVALATGLTMSHVPVVGEGLCRLCAVALKILDVKIEMLRANAELNRIDMWLVEYVGALLAGGTSEGGIPAE